MIRSAALALLLAGSTPAMAQPPPDVLRAFSHEPPVGALQRAASQSAELHPERVRSWLWRVRRAAVLPALKFRVGHGSYGLNVAQSSGSVAYTPSSESWRFEIEASWSFDRLVFDHNEIGVSREASRIATRREALLTEVAQLYYARRRLQVEALTAQDQDAEALERRLSIDELTAVLDGLTDGALSKGNR